MKKTIKRPSICIPSTFKKGNSVSLFDSNGSLILRFFKTLLNKEAGFHLRHETETDRFSNKENDEKACEMFQYPKKFKLQYEIAEEIGNGMQATVTKIKERSTSKLFAAKIYETKEEEIINMTRSEAQIIKCIEHPNIIQFKEFIEEPENNYHILILEYFQSISLKAYIEQTHYCKEEFDFIIKQIHDGLKYLHNMRITHRDFNINNILIDPKSLQIKIIDFGLARFVDKNKEFIYSPHGSIEHRIPFIESLMNPFFEDVWGFATIALCLLLRKHLSSKKVLRLYENFLEKPSNCTEEFINIFLFLKKAMEMGAEVKEENHLTEIGSPVLMFLLL